MNLPDPHPKMSEADVWTLLSEGVNAEEIAAYAGVALSVARAMMARARAVHARASA